MKSAKVNARCLDCGRRWTAQYASVDQGICTDSPGPCPYCHWPAGEIRTEWLEEVEEAVSKPEVLDSVPSVSDLSAPRVLDHPDVVAVVRNMSFHKASAVIYLAQAGSESIAHNLECLKRAAANIQLEIERLS